MEFNHAVRVVRAQLNTKRTLVTSDIHGCADLLKALLEKMKYRPGEDALVVIGDLVQKGSQNLDTVRFVKTLSKNENVFVLQGNNDLFTLEGPDEEIFAHGSHFQERSVLGEMAAAMDEPFPKNAEETHILREKAQTVFSEELTFLRGLPHILETERFLFAHAGLESENLEEQNLEYVLAVPRFHETAACRFHKMLLVGHWPVGNFRTDSLSCAPVYNKSKNVLSIDGGNTIKRFGQLVGVILNNETGSWDWTGVDNLPKIQAPCSQKARPGTVVTWPENFVELLERGEVFSRCRVKKNGAVLSVPNDFLYEDKKGLRVNSATDARLEVSKGEMVSLVKEGDGWLMIMKNGEAGMLVLNG